MSWPSKLKKRTFALIIATVTLLFVGAQSTATPAQSAARKKAETAPARTYVCPMHPDVKSVKQGNCPKCGMALRLTERDGKEVTKAADDDAKSNPPRSGASDPRGASSKMVIPDIDVLDQNGNQLRFYRDLIKGKTIAINFIFTNCTTICPPLGATFARVQKELGDKVGRDVYFISISVDPLTDTPERLKAWGAKFKAGDGWTFVTGEKQQIDKLLAALGASVARREDHSPTVIVGNDVTGDWVRTYGLAKPSQIVELILNVMQGKTAESSMKEHH